jgi:transcriptional regulator with XRE-family HTH domain
VYYLDRKRVLDADLLIIIADYPSFGVGQEIEIASSFGTPTILVVRDGVTVSRMVKGGFLNLIDDITYTSPEDLERKLSKCLARNLDEIKSIKNTKTTASVSLVGGVLAQYRERLGYTQKDVAQSIGISSHMVEAIENYPIHYHNSSYYVLAKLCNFYGIKLTDVTTSAEAIATPSVDDSNIKRLEEAAKELGWPTGDYLELKQGYVTELAASGRSSSIITQQNWIARHNQLQKKRLNEKSRQKTLFPK